MKKLLLSACICLAASVQACTTLTSIDLDGKSDQEARNRIEHHFNHAPMGELFFIVPESIHVSLRRFDDFLTWKFWRGSIVHVVVLSYLRGGCGGPKTLSYLLGFSPDLAVRDGAGMTAEDLAADCPVFKKVFNQYRKNPWRHPENVFEFEKFSHDPYIYDGEPFARGKKDGEVPVVRNDPLVDKKDVDVPFKQSSFIGKIFDKKVFLGVLGAIVLFGLYKYTDKDKKSNRLRRSNR